VYLPQFLLSNDNETAHMDETVPKRTEKLNDLNKNNNNKPFTYMS
jgi:hypothetical protein